MNVGGGEAADQLVRMMLSGTEVAVRLGGSALKNLLALTMALAKNNKVLSGKVNMGKMLRETRDLRRFPMTKQQYKEFKKLAKKHKLLYSVIRDKTDRGSMMDVILPVTELDRANAIFEQILYTLPPEQERKPARELQQGRQVFQRERQAPERERPAPEKDRAVSGPEKGRQGQEKPRREQDQPPPVQGRQDGPKAQRQAQRREEVKTPKKDSRSGQGSNGTRTSSSTSRESGGARTTHDQRPSVEQKLKVYRVQLEQRRTSVPARAKAKAAVKNRPKAR